jgi:hypothetical protein
VSQIVETKILDFRGLRRASEGHRHLFAGRIGEGPCDQVSAIDRTRVENRQR